MLIELLCMPRAEDIDATDEVENSYVWEAETVVSVTWVKDEDFSR
jgi:hypothetical protein